MHVAREAALDAILTLDLFENRPDLLLLSVAWHEHQCIIVVMRDPISAEALEDYKSRLSRWLAPADFIRTAEQLRTAVSGYQYFNDPKAAFARDAWIAARLASVSASSDVRLGSVWPDYEERSDGAIVQFEITEADIPGRRRGDEYKTMSVTPHWTMDPGEDWIARAEQAPTALRTAAEAKARKGYPPSARLVIYLNIGEHGIRQKEIEAAMAEMTAPARKAFQQVWVLWKARLYRLWKDAERDTLIVQIPDALGL